MQVAIQPTMNTMTRTSAHSAFEMFDTERTGFVEVAQFRDVLRHWGLQINGLAAIMLARKFAGAGDGSAALDAPPSLGEATGAPPQQLGKVNYESFLTWAYGGRYLSLPPPPPPLPPSLVTVLSGVGCTHRPMSVRGARVATATMIWWAPYPHSSHLHGWRAGCSTPPSLRSGG